MFKENDQLILLTNLFTKNQDRKNENYSQHLFLEVFIYIFFFKMLSVSTN